MLSVSHLERCNKNVLYVFTVKYFSNERFAECVKNTECKQKMSFAYTP